MGDAQEIVSVFDGTDYDLLLENIIVEEELWQYLRIR